MHRPSERLARPAASRRAPKRRGARAALVRIGACLGAVVAGTTVGLSATPGLADAEPSAQLRVGRGPYYVGEPVEIHVQTTGLARDPEPRCSAEPPDGATLSLAGIVPSISTSVQIVNGQMKRTESVTYVCQYVLVASRPGSVRIASFVVEQGARVARTQPYEIRIEEIPMDPRVRIRLEMTDGPVYIGQKIPVHIEWWIDETLQNSIRRYAIRSPLFDAPDTFRFVDDEVAMRGDQNLEISTTEGDIAIRAEIAERQDAGRKFLVVSATRHLVPLRTGSFDLAPATLNLEEVTGWQRDLFGSRRPADTRRLFARDQALHFDVESAPLEGRPASFGGAVGKCFSIDVSTDRSVVQRGDPITLTVTVRGDGLLSSVGLPPLDGPGGLPSDHFRLLDDDLSGELVDGAKRFRVPLRVLDETVREIPAIEYAWFDPDLGRYQSTRSLPIALAVRPAEIVSADDVVAAPSAERPAEDRATASGSERATPAPARGSRDMGIGADLSIERRLERLAARPGPGRRPILIALYGCGLSMLIGAGLWRQRGRTSPRVARLRALQADARARIVKAKDRPGREALAEVASALRALTSADPALHGDEVERYLRECDELLYAPDVAAPGVAATTAPAGTTEAIRLRIDRALAIVDALAESIR